jgi:hypothetical protein
MEHDLKAMVRVKNGSHGGTGVTIYHLLYPYLKKMLFTVKPIRMDNAFSILPAQTGDGSRENRRNGCFGAFHGSPRDSGPKIFDEALSSRSFSSSREI